jgi:hypothetical protein
MTEKIRNALNDLRVEFALVPSPALRELLARDEHPAVKPLPLKHKYTMMNCPDGKCIPVARQIVINYVEGKSTENERFILDRCDIRVIGNFGVSLPAGAGGGA